MAPAPRQDSITVKVAGPPPCSWLATSGSSADRPALCRKNRKMRSSTALRRWDCKAKFKPTRMAPRKRSPGSVLLRGSERQRRMSTKDSAASKALSANTAAGLTAAIRPPASMGPITRDRFMDTPLSASAEGSCARGTICGTMAENTGQRMARPTPLAKVSASKTGAVNWPDSDTTASTSATTDTQSCVAAK